MSIYPPSSRKDERTVTALIPIRIGDRSVEAVLTMRVQAVDDWFIDSVWHLFSTLRIGDKEIVKLDLDWIDVRGRRIVSLEHLSNTASTRSDTAYERFSEEELRGLEGIGHRVFCRVLSTLEREWPFFLERGKDTVIHVRTSNRKRAGYYKTYGFRSGPKSGEMVASVREIERGCEDRLDGRY